MKNSKYQFVLFLFTPRVLTLNAGISMVSVTEILPFNTVPVITVPFPFMEKQWSTENINGPIVLRLGRKHSSLMHVMSSSRPSDSFTSVSLPPEKKRKTFFAYIVWRTSKTLKSKSSINVTISLLTEKSVVISVFNLSPVPNPQFFGHTGTCEGSGILTKVLDSARSDKQTDKTTALFRWFWMPNNYTEL